MRMNEQQDSVFNNVAPQEPAAEPRDFTAFNNVAPQEPAAAPRDFTAFNNVAPQEPAAEPRVLTAEPPRKGKGLLVGLGCLVLALLVAGGWWLLGHRFRPSPLASLRQSAEKSLDAYMDYIRELPNLSKCAKNLRALYTSDTKHYDLTAAVESDELTELGGQFSLRLGMDRDERAKKALLHVNFESEAMTLPLDLYLDRNQLQIGSSYLLNEGEAIAVPVKDFGEKWNDSALGKLAEVTLPEDFSLSFLLGSDSGEGMEEAFGSDWTDFVDSVCYRAATAEDGVDCFTGEGESYVLTWDQALLDKLGERADREMSAINKGRMDKLIPCARIELLNVLCEELEAPRFRVLAGALTGISFRTQSEDSKNQYFRIELLGEDNPWSRSVVCVDRYDPATGKTETVSAVEYTLSVADGQLYSKAVEIAPAADAGTTVLEFAYRDSDGVFTVITVGDLANMSSLSDDSFDSASDERAREYLESVELRMTPTEKGVRLEEKLDSGALESDIDSTPVTIQITLELGTKIETIRPLSEEPIELLELPEMNLGVLVMRIMSKFKSASGLPFGGSY